MKKGFTLIELLAVIVILAIIALIATPIILGIIEDARKGSIEASANGYIDAVEYKIASNEIKGEETTSGVYDVTSLDVDLDGEKPTSGSVIIEKGKVSNATITINNQTVYYDGNVPKVIDDKTSNYKEEILNGADPQVKDELVPVVITNDGTVIKVNQKINWYNYEEKEWANAVILFNEDKYNVGDIIPEENIKEYYVWIPKYAYRLWNVNSDNTDNVGKPIEIIFGDKATTTGTNNGDMYTHPAFTNFNTEGIWVGKFELSYNEETYVDSTKFLSTNPNYEITKYSHELIIKPNVRAITYTNVNIFHMLLINAHKNLNSHMMTNMEWGAAAYLTYSVYGRCDDETCTEVTKNNVSTGYYGSNALFEGQWEWSASITGCAADTIVASVISNRDACINSYNIEKGYLASTTGNITGIYDMSGGSWEYVMGVLVQQDGTIITGRNSWTNSGFKGIYGCPTCDGNTSGVTENTEGLDMPDLKYYNAYKNNYELNTDNWYDYSEGMLGDATKEVANTKSTSTSNEMGNWYEDNAHFVVSSIPWFIRGGNYNNGSVAGIFAYGRAYGGMLSEGSTRAVLAF